MLAAQLTYELEILGKHMPADAARRLPKPGNISTATTWTLAGLPDGEYRWRVRAVDSTFAGGEIAGGQFAIGDTLFANGFEVDER